MSQTRRRFLQAAAAGGAVAGIGGFSALSAWVSPAIADFLAGDTAVPPFRAPEAAEIDDAAHVLNRLTFGARPGDHAKVAAMGAKAFIAAQLAPEKIEDQWTDRRVRHFEALTAAPMGELLEYGSKEILDQLTRAKIVRARHSQRQLLEVMVDFWSDHFNIDPSKGDSRWLKVADDRDVIRRHALGRFPEMVKASAMSAAMLWYLDGRVNRRREAGDKPNENYARELMELHTLGVHGGYTQRDVMEVARCLTGWTVRDRKKLFKGRVEFRARDHDDGPKTVLGREIPAGLGARDLDRVLEIVTSHPSTANYIAWKLCRRFIHDDPPAAAVSSVAKAFADSQGDIRATLRALFATAEFRAPETRGVKFKRPFHFVVSALRATNAKTDASPALVEYLQRLGHAPFRYPTPDGYPEEAPHWQSTLLWRWNFAAALAENRIGGTRIMFEELRRKIGGDESVIATFFGRKPTGAESAAYQGSGAGVALLVAAPAFQRC